MLDVVGHEFGHGVDDHTPGGISGGGTQEFVADTFGAATEWYANNPTDTPDFTVGERVNLVGSGPIRYMYNPSLAGDANCYSSSASRPRRSTRRPVRATTGSTCSPRAPTRPTASRPARPATAPSVTGIGIQNAEQIMYNAMLMKTSTSSYLKYRTWTLTAAKNLDATCATFNTVKAAWNAVSVPAQAADPTCTDGRQHRHREQPGHPDRHRRHGEVAAADRRPTRVGPDAHLVGHRSAGRPVDQRLHRPDQRHADHGRHLQLDGDRHATPPAPPAPPTFTWTISGGRRGGCASPGQKLGNPGFETGTAPLDGDRRRARQLRRRAGARRHLEGLAGRLRHDPHRHAPQSVTIPAGCAATLTFWLHIDTAETTTTTAYDKLTVKAGATTLATYSNLNKATGYSQKSFNLSSFAGQTVTISFTGAEDSSLQTSFVIDDTALNRELMPCRSSRPPGTPGRPSTGRPGVPAVVGRRSSSVEPVETHARPPALRWPARRGWSGGRGTGGMSDRCRGRSGLRRAGRWATPTRGNPRDSATENRPPGPSSVELVVTGGGAGKGETVVQETTSDPGDRIGSVNPARSKVEQRTLEGCPPECAGGPHEVAGNGGPRWMVAERSVARRPGTEPGLQTSPSASGL